ncbi:S9 family peptidase [Asticcacaulis sp. 201]|uniref:alpha/beta hydrolase family protein n=1 Tax=Asticcacaulis sp. 201 TaxID=3028787 RepID=UPI002916FC2E|nr:S9 family peptidase [Asticcacaulis sp. 201]MDV6329881.1 S9 family peptidase [Asticcacaulis sp. 201]
MTSELDRRGLLRLSAAVATTGLLPAISARADDLAPLPPVEAYAAPPLVDQIAVSPDGKRIAMISQSGDDKVLIHFTIAENKPNYIGIGPAKIRDLFWGDNEHVVITNSRTTIIKEFVGYKQEFFFVRSVNLKTRDVLTLFSKEDGFYDIVVGGAQRIKVDGEYRVAASGYRMGPPNLCLFSFAPDKPRGHLVMEGTNDTQNFVLTPDGFPIAYATFNNISKAWRLYYNTGIPGKTNRFTCIYETVEPLNMPVLEGLGRDGQSVVVYFSKDELKGEYHEIGADGVLQPALEVGDAKSTNLLFHPTTGRLIGYSHSDDWITYTYFDPLMKKLTALLPQVMGQKSRIRFAGFAEDPRQMILYGESATDAGTYYFVDATTGHVSVLARNYTHLPPEWLSEKQPIAYKAADGLDIHGYLTLPPRKVAKSLPLVVLPHGGPEARDYGGFDWQSQVLASRGYAVLQPNFRGSSGYGSAFAEAGYGEWGKKMQTDLSDGVRHLVKLGLVDPKRVAILGASYGGYAALAGATLDPGIYNCAVSIAGVSDARSLIDFEVSNSAGFDSPRVLALKQYLGDAKFYNDISPARQADKAYCPILLVHGTDDTVVPISQSRKMESALKAAGKPVEFVTYKGQDHWETVGSARIDMMKAALAFLEKYNPAG